MPTPREIMEAQRRRALEAAAEVEHDMQELERIVSKYNLLVIPSPDGPPPELEPETNVERSRYARSAQQAEGIIRAGGHPMSVGDIFRILTVERGLNLKGPHPVNSLSTAMSVSRNLRYIRDIGWWIRDVPWPPTAEDVANLQANSAVIPQKKEPIRSKGGARRSPEKQALLNALREIIGSRTAPILFNDLFDAIKARGLRIGGSDERRNLASYLSKYPCFETAGRSGGWRYLRERDFDLAETQADTFAQHITAKE